MKHQLCRRYRSEAFKRARRFVPNERFCLAGFTQTAGKLVSGKRYFWVDCPADFKWQGAACCAFMAVALAVEAFVESEIERGIEHRMNLT